MKGRKTGGRRPGSPNHVTVEFRETVRALLEDNRANVSAWLTRVADDDAYKALQVIISLAEYAYPKLARTEVVGDGGGPLRIVASKMDEDI